MNDTAHTLSATDILNDELERINSRRRQAGFKTLGTPATDAIGLALSGGGIRSATFNLGILQSLNRVGLLRSIDYLSTVSGGGYIGSSLTWFTSRLKGPFPFDTSEQASGDQAKKLLARFRERGRYLTPGGGLGWWALVAALLNGIAINLLVIVPFFSLALWLFCCRTPNTLRYFGWLLLGVAFLAGFFYALTTRLDWARSGKFARSINKIMGASLMGGIMALVVASIPQSADFIEQHASSWLHSVLSAITLSGIITLLSSLAGMKRSKGPQGAGSLLLLIGLSLLMYGVFLWIFVAVRGLNSAVDLLWPLLISMAIIACADINQVSMHRFYRNRLMEAYLPTRVRTDWNQKETEPILDYSTTTPTPTSERDADLCLLKDIPQTASPYQLINATVQTVGSRLPKLKARGGHNFLFSPLFCGSDCTGYTATSAYIQGKVNLATAMAVSGAAVDPNTQATRSRPLAFLMTLLNVRLGYWIRSPRYITSNGGRWRTPSWLIIFAEMFGWGLDETNSSLHLSDGGHFDNLGLYELVRRQCRHIIVCDGTADSSYTFADLAKAIELVRADFGAEITIDTRPLQPREADRKISSEACVIGEITYESGLKGTLVFITTTLIGGLSEDIYAYQRLNPAFPDQGTGDQFFDEQQFEAYRELGLQVGFRYFSQLASEGQPLDLLRL